MIYLFLNQMCYDVVDIIYETRFVVGYKLNSSRCEKGITAWHNVLAELNVNYCYS